MIYVYATLLLLLFLINEQIGLSAIAVLVSSFVLYLLAYNNVRKTHSQLITAIVLMTISLPFSWNAIWGGKVGSSVFTWYYFWTLVTIVLLFAGGKRLTYVKTAFISLCILAYSFIPLIMSNSIAEGFKEFIMIGFFIVIMLGVSVKRHYIGPEERNYLLNIYIFTMTLIGIGMIIQFIGYSFFGLKLFGFKIAYTWDYNVQTGCHLLMEDASSGTIMLGVGAILALINRAANKKYYLAIILMVAGMACSGRRTAIVTLVVIMAIYVVVGVKSIKGKIGAIFFYITSAYIGLFFLGRSRNVNSVYRLLYDNGRYTLWRDGFILFLRSPIFGYGFDNEYLVNVLMPTKMIVHNTLIRWLDMGGAIYGILMVALFVAWFSYMIKIKEKDMLWACFYSISASMLIPDLLNARFMYLIAIISFLALKESTAMLVKGEE